MKKLFLVLAFFEGRLISKPFMVLAENVDESLQLAVRDLFKQGVGRPDIDLMAFDVENDVIHLGELDMEDAQNLAEECGCECPNGEACDHYMFGGCTFGKGCGGGEDVEFIHNDPPEEIDDPIFKPDELIFAVIDADESVKAAGVDYVVVLNTRSHWEKSLAEGKPSMEELGGYNVEDGALTNGGCCYEELTGSYFEALPGLDRETIFTRMLEAGFGYMQSFQEWIDSQDERE